jgi:phosphoadenosine phosphosulfate reductase
MKGGDGSAEKKGKGSGGRAGRRVISDADRQYGRLTVFRRKVDRALDLIAGAARPLGVAVSGGKDSTVVLHLVRRVYPDAVAGFFHSGAELQDTLDWIEATPNVQTIPAGGGGLIELCKANGYWGHTPESDHPQVVDFGEALIYQPATAFIRRNRLATVALGLRAGESGGRRMSAQVRGTRYDVGYMSERVGWNVQHLCPIQWWTEDDVWAYIAVHDLTYNVAYDKMAAMGMTRKEQRISTLLGTDAAAYGRYVFLKRLDLELWNRLVAEFPLLLKYV